ncbi:PrpF protein [Xylogone sp. PMI_703]|nr:PrpF protein [Xylogone sp. PMI_703]
MSTLRASFWRGGVCNALIFDRADLPEDCSAWQPIFAAAMGSPDSYGRQLNGMGGGSSSLSKICIVSPSMREDADVDFEFVQVVISDGSLDLASNCGNMIAAIGPFAVDNGLTTVPKVENPSIPTSVTIRIYNTNTKKVIHSTFSVVGYPSRFYPHGDGKMNGVPGTASRISLSFISPGGTQTDKSLPTGDPVALLDTRDHYSTRILASLVDIANPGIYVDGSKLGIDPNTRPEELDRHTKAMDLLERIRREGAERMGLDANIASVPKLVLVFACTTEEASKAVTLKCLVLSMGQTHRAIPLTLALNLGAASKINGTIPFILANQRDPGKDVVIQHPSGTIQVGIKMNGQEVEIATLYSTARLLMQGEVNIER